jgi:hypothetical protein
VRPAEHLEQRPLRERLQLAVWLDDGDHLAASIRRRAMLCEARIRPVMALKVRLASTTPEQQQQFPLSIGV